MGETRCDVCRYIAGARLPGVIVCDDDNVELVVEEVDGEDEKYHALNWVIAASPVLQPHSGCTGHIIYIRVCASGGLYHI